MALNEDKMIIEWEVKEVINITLDLAIVTEIRIIAAMLFLKTRTHTPQIVVFVSDFSLSLSYYVEWEPVVLNFTIEFIGHPDHSEDPHPGTIAYHLENLEMDTTAGKVLCPPPPC